MFIRRDDGQLSFMDRVKYLIKSGGENIYPAEVERVLLSDPGVDDAVVVRRPIPIGVKCRLLRSQLMIHALRLINYYSGVSPNWRV
ncbi:MAG: hypothetical protein Ct9H300mP13_2630 [Gammaproteobacteria bacterium]|nr:MAG: hypothetical protein Ct9H300mP13_2630 [Gammaproteobacteria bacterium]